MPKQGMITVHYLTIEVDASHDHAQPLADALNEIRESGERIISVIDEGSLCYTIVTEEE